MNELETLIRQRMEQVTPPDVLEKLVLPSPISFVLGVELLEFDESVPSLRCQYPVNDDHRNPYGYLQGGILAALMDNTIGILGLLVAPPSVTTQFNISYIRPVTPQETVVQVRAMVTERTRRMLFFHAKALNTAGKTLSMAQATQQITDVTGR
jgi:uncharacterized protein (TIGR00369 family)